MILILLATFVFAIEDVKKEDLELLHPIAKERSDGYNLPEASFSESNGVESWFVKEKGFQTDEKKASKRRGDKRDPASYKKKIERRKKKRRQLKRNRMRRR